MNRSDPSSLERVTAVAGAIATLAGGIVWSGAWVAATINGHGWRAPPSAAFGALTHLPHHLTTPQTAWPQADRAVLPNPIIYWSATATITGLAVLVTATVIRRWPRSKVGTVPRRPLGVDARARFATPKDLAPLAVRGPQPGRFPLGSQGRRRLATELPHDHGTRHRRGRRGDRGAVALIGPSRSGKTTAAITGILEWEGPAVLSSVKSDLLAATYPSRKNAGNVLVYDPTHTTVSESAVWSPLRAADTVLGAQRAARALCDAAPRSDDVKGGLGYWLAQSEILLSGLLYIAAQAGVHMDGVCEWIMVQDRPREHAPGEVQTALEQLLASDDPVVRDGATRAAQAVMSIWEMEDETRSSVYGTAQTVIWPWADPGVAAAARGRSLNLDWLLAGNNTVYLCAPIEDQQRLAPAFGGLLNDLVKQVFLKVAATGRPIEPALLLVIDEAGNTPLRSLPQYASTLSGLGVLLVTVWQSIAQLEEAYGRQADTILTNHLSKILFPGLSDPASFRYLAQVLGNVEVETRSRGETPDARRSVQLSTSREPLVPPHVARGMASGDALLIHGSLPPAHVRTIPWWEQRRVSARVE